MNTDTPPDPIAERIASTNEKALALIDELMQDNKALREQNVELRTELETLRTRLYQQRVP